MKQFINGFECYLNKERYPYNNRSESYRLVKLTRKYAKKINKYNKRNDTAWTNYPIISLKNLHLPEEKNKEPLKEMNKVLIKIKENDYSQESIYNGMFGYVNSLWEYRTTIRVELLPKYANQIVEYNKRTSNHWKIQPNISTINIEKVKCSKMIKNE